ncbi:hypothetical protein HPB47_017915, partial [Ixodes persulcatus]
RDYGRERALLGAALSTSTAAVIGGPSAPAEGNKLLHSKVVDLWHVFTFFSRNQLPGEP